MELSDIEELGELQAIEAELAELLAAEDVVHLAAAMDPGSTAGVLIWENLWAAPFAAAARRSGGQLIAERTDPDPGHHRLDRGRRSAAPKETDMPLRAARVGRVGVIGHPVAKTAVVAKAVTPGPRPSRRPQSSPRPSPRAASPANLVPARDSCTATAPCARGVSACG